jgi:hypothetical protein
MKIVDYLRENESKIEIVKNQKSVCQVHMIYLKKKFKNISRYCPFKRPSSSGRDSTWWQETRAMPSATFSSNPIRWGQEDLEVDDLPANQSQPLRDFLFVAVILLSPIIKSLKGTISIINYLHSSLRWLYGPFEVLCLKLQLLVTLPLRYYNYFCKKCVVVSHIAKNCHVVKVYHI